MDGESPRAPAFLNVERSLSGKRWRSRLTDERAALGIAQRLGVPDILGRVLAARGVGIEEAEAFLEPKLRNLLPDPSHLLDMDTAVTRIVKAIDSGEKIGVFADYDVDGACSASLLVRFFSELGRKLDVYVPDRITEGYGPNTPALKKLMDGGVSLLITVDCGTTAFTALKAASEAGLDVIVIDHHVAEPNLPEAIAVVNPNRLDEVSPIGQLCAAGMTFMLIIAINRALRDAYWYGEGHSEPDLMRMLDLVALATVADVVPLTGVNRALVQNGLKVMARRENPGLAALAEVSQLSEKPEAWHLGFMLGPRVNAGGRVGDSGLGVRLLTTMDRNEALNIATRLDQYNTERRAIEVNVLEAAMDQAQQQVEEGTPLIFAYAQGWHPGVIGIIAGRLKEKFNRPACVVSIENGLGKGSGRSIRGIDLGPAVIAAHQAGHLVNGGGHAMAAGFTVVEERLLDFRHFITDHIKNQIDGEILTPDIGIDAALSPEGASLDFIETLTNAGPFGASNPRPRFVFSGVTPINARVVGTDHVSCFIATPEGSPRLKSIAFRTAGSPVGDALLHARGGILHVAGYLNIDNWQGDRKPQLIIEDVARAR
ncbi:MAG: Single-stranded-DNA-specific exonuclease RecJ [Alphaproteobacteria bacterium MarineAlpha11_Bin1]|nr:MAG: Single-stranded-DNA-specific exonuclease RecJ [Alphaproteobacteria bacterium MarineAlpha11_Bin1]|tara:strand:- start:1183 stop:2976 length:1794 start_codon:yes stop_codon:yes gene_type:complete